MLLPEHVPPSLANTTGLPKEAYSSDTVTASARAVWKLWLRYASNEPIETFSIERKAERGISSKSYIITSYDSRSTNTLSIMDFFQGFFQWSAVVTFRDANPQASPYQVPQPQKVRRNGRRHSQLAIAQLIPRLHTSVSHHLAHCLSGAVPMQHPPTDSCLLVQGKVPRSLFTQRLIPSGLVPDYGNIRGGCGS